VDALEVVLPLLPVYPLRETVTVTVALWPTVRPETEKAYVEPLSGGEPTKIEPLFTEKAYVLLTL
jgi:hypothetical protein